jgi:hypothetical protein
MKRNIFFDTNIKVLLICLLTGLSCSKKATDYRSYLNNEERIYPGTITSAAALPGNGRLMLTWRPSPDPSVTRYVVYWNNYTDSVVVNAASHNPSDTIKTIIGGLAEYNYSFYINSFDASGNKSITATIGNARVYGAIYRSTLHNRLPNTATPFVVNNDNSVTLNFTTPDTINIATLIKYTNAAGVQSQATLSPTASSVTLPSYQSGTPVLYQSSYVPAIRAIDTFYTNAADTFPAIFRLVICNKGLFKEMSLPGDAGVYESGTSVSKLWDGSVGPQGYPNIYHSNDAQNIPLAFSFDMGKVYNHLATVEETGRNCCHNPDDFEIWGIADTTGAIPALATQNAGWKAQMQSKGWALLTEAFRGDDGSAPVKFDFSSTAPPVRFIRIRVIHVVSGSNNSANMSELTFWNKE